MIARCSPITAGAALVLGGLATLLAGCDRVVSRSEQPAPRASEARLEHGGPPAAPEPPPSASSLPSPSPEALRELAAGSNAFGLDLYRHLAERPGNLALSPSSVHLALAMAWAGARGETAKQLADGLRLSDDRTRVLSGARELFRAWEASAQSRAALTVRNRLFGQQGFAFERPYLTTVEQAFGASLQPIDFMREPERSRGAINRWVAEQTNDRIRDLIPPGGVKPLTRLVLVNTVLFLGEWKQAFKESNTEQLPFFTGSGAQKTVPMMRARATFSYARSGAVEILELPYAGETMAMTVVLPTKRAGLRSVERALTPEQLASWLAGLKRRTVIVYLPRFTIDPPGSLSLRSPLLGMGMSLPFDPDRADFEGIADPAASGRLLIDDVVHKAFIRVDEKGTEAAAATAVLMAVAASSGPHWEPPTFRADHPFLFFLRDLRSGAVLFLGRVDEA